MRGIIIFLSLCAFTLIIHHASVLMHNLSPSLRVVQKRVPMNNMDARQLGHQIKEGRSYFRNIVYEERRQTKGLIVDIQRDTTSSDVVYEDHE